jgi:hypothetical protein
MRIALLAFVAALAACSSGGSNDTHVVADAGSPNKESPVDAAPAPATWTSVYDTYFGPGTPGHCGNAGCHATIRSGFLCGPTKDTCYQGLVSASLLSLTAPATSSLADPASSPLTWFGGIMPQDNQGPNEAAADAVKAWITAGAQDD